MSPTLPATEFGQSPFSRHVGPIECHRALLVRGGGFRSQQGMGFKPERAGCREWIYSDISPPRSFIAAAMDLTVVRAT
jgi:hypothetical protein